MAVQNLGNETTTVYAEGPELVWERIFDAPRELVWKAHTEPERVARWWGPRKYSTEVIELDVRPGGKWRYINRNADGEHPFRGEFLEVVPPEKLVWTFMYDVEPFNQEEAWVETFLFEDLGDGRTKLNVRSHFPSVEALQGALSTGMIEGGIETYDRLAEELARG
jgi:uncharacterized protein YndB with AHSA1/START domain